MISDTLVPTGYVPLRYMAIRNQLEDWSLRGVSFSRYQDEKALLGSPYDLGRELVAGRFDIAGYDLNTGELLQIPRSAWRLGYQGERKSHDSQVDAALAEGEPVVSADATGRWLYPLLRLRDLAEWVGASIQLGPPLISPSATKMEVDPANIGPMHAWMRGFAQARKDAGKVIKRDEALKLLQQHFPKNVTWEHEEAYEALPYPDLRNVPRTRKET